MGSGKSYLGQALAKELNIKFYDTDELIEKSLGKSISEIFEIFGEDYFRLSEHEILKIFSPNETAIVATGGGLPMSASNMDLMKSNGMVIYLECNPSVITERLKNEQAKRPLISNLDHKELQSFVINSLNDRKVKYEKAHMIYHLNNGQEPILKELKDYLSLFL